jgi:hypothetical protein
VAFDAQDLAIVQGIVAAVEIGVPVIILRPITLADRNTTPAFANASAPLPRLALYRF